MNFKWRSARFAFLLIAFFAPAWRVVADQMPRAQRIGDTELKPLERWRVERPGGPSIDAFVARGQKKQPLIVLVSGSHCLPLFMIKPKRVVSTLFVQPDNLAPHLGRAHFAIIERRGVHSFGPPPASEEEVRALDQCTAKRGGVSKPERVTDVVDGIRAFAQEPWVENVHVVGHSEGADVAAGVGRVLGNKVLSVGLLSGAGPTRFVDDMALAHRGQHLEQVKAALDDLIALTGPNPPLDYAGASSVRQKTYAIDSTPLDDLRATHQPLFVAGGTRDEKSPIESADVFVAEILRNPKRKLRYLILPNLDHGYLGPKGDAHMKQVLNAYLDWVLTSPKDRSVFVGFPQAVKPAAE